jgi:hypothetical protein
MFILLPYSLNITPATTARDTVIVSQMGPMIVEGPA